jgi:hypothetical protein
MRCAKCGKQRFEDSPISIIWKGETDEAGLTKYEDYCFGCGMEELRKALKGVPLTIEVPHYPEYTPEELGRHGAAINYTAELTNYPPHK